MRLSNGHRQALRRVRAATAALDQADVEWRQSVATAIRLGVDLRKIQHYAGTTLVQIKNMQRQLEELEILLEKDKAQSEGRVIKP